MNFLTDELTQNMSAIDAKLAQHETLNEEDLKVLLINLLQIEDSHENE